MGTSSWSLPPSSGESENGRDLSVSVIGSELRSDEENGGKTFAEYLIQVRTPYSSWVVKRRYRKFRMLYSTLQNEWKGVKIPKPPARKLVGDTVSPEFVEERRLALHSYLQELCEIKEIWNSSTFISFLDDTSTALGIQMQYERVSEDVFSLHQTVQTLQSSLANALDLISSQQSTIRRLEGRVDALEGSQESRVSGRKGRGGGNSVDLRSSECTDTTTASCDSTSPSETPYFSKTDRSNKREQSNSGELGDRMSPSSQVSSDEGGGHVRVKSNLSIMIEESNNNNIIIEETRGDHHRTATREVVSSDSERSSDDILVPKSSTRKSEEMVSTPHGFLSLSGVFTPTNHSPLIPPSPPISSFSSPSHNLRPISFDSNTPSLNFVKSELLDKEMGMVLELIKPTEIQILHRESISSFIGNNVKKTLGARCCPLGVFGLRCNLPDDPIRLCIFMCRAHEATWFIRANESLCFIATDPEVAQSSYLPFFFRHQQQ